MDDHIDIKLSLYDYVWTFVALVWDFFSQKWFSRRLPSAADVCHEGIKGKICIVTGATSGIGLETAKVFAFKGAHVVLAVRGVATAEGIVNEWRNELKNISVEIRHLDLNSLESVRNFCKNWPEDKPIHVLINNAGIFSMGGKYRMTSDGWEEHFSVNYLSQSLMTLLLLPNLKLADGARVVNVSSKMHELGEFESEDPSFSGKNRRYSPIAAYCQSKLVQVMFTSSLHKKLPRKAKIDIIAIHPGEVVTNVARTLPSFFQWGFKNLMPLFAFRASDGARTSLYCATDPSVSEYCTYVRLSGEHGPYYASNCVATPVAKQARNSKTNDALLVYTLEKLSLPANYIEVILS